MTSNWLVQIATVSTDAIPFTADASHVGRLQVKEGAEHEAHGENVFSAKCSAASSRPIRSGLPTTWGSPLGTSAAFGRLADVPGPSTNVMTPRGVWRCPTYVGGSDVVAAVTYPRQNPSMGNDGRGAASMAAQSRPGEKEGLSALGNIVLLLVAIVASNVEVENGEGGNCGSDLLQRRDRVVVGVVAHGVTNVIIRSRIMIE